MESPRAVACSWMTERQSSEMHSRRQRGLGSDVPSNFTFTASLSASHKEQGGTIP